MGVLIQTLVAFGNCIGRTAYFQVEADRHYCNLYAVLVGATAKGRKGTSLGHVKKLFAVADPEWAGHSIKTGLSTGEGLIHAVRDARGEDPGVKDKRLLAVEPEFATLLRHMERQGNVLSSQLRQCWDSPRLCETLTRSNPVKVTEAHVSVIGHITADELRRYLSATEQASGFANRFLWIAVRRSKCLPEGGRLCDDDLNALTATVRAAAAFARGTAAVPFNDGARRLWYDVYPQLSEGRPGLSGAMIGRAEAQVRRLATVYALLDQSPECRPQHLLAALALWAYTEKSVYFIFGTATGDSVADAILEGLRDGAEKGLTRTAISQLFKGNRRKTEIDRGLGVLRRCGLAHSRKNPTGGRDEERWFPGPTKETKETN